MAADFSPDDPAVRKTLAQALDEGRHRLTDPEAKALLAAYGIPFVHTHVARSADEAVKLAAEIGYPVALKVLSPDLEHRAEVGGVMLNLENEQEVRAAARDIGQRMAQYRPDARMAGFTVQRMIRPRGAVHRRHGARESTLRASRDAVFAPALDMLGREDDRTRAIAVLRERLSQLLAHHPEIVELEIDPLLVDDEGAMALEVRARVARTDTKSGDPTRANRCRTGLS